MHWNSKTTHKIFYSTTTIKMKGGSIKHCIVEWIKEKITQIQVLLKYCLKYVKSKWNLRNIWDIFSCECKCKEANDVTRHSTMSLYLKNKTRYGRELWISAAECSIFQDCHGGRGTDS